MNNIYLSHNNIISSLGFDSETVATNIGNKMSGLQHVDDSKLLPQPFYASLIDDTLLNTAFGDLPDAPSGKEYTRLEKMMLCSLHHVLRASQIPIDERTGLIISTTKGNIDTLDKENPFPESRAYLGVLGEKIKEFFGFRNEAIVLSNACVSGILAVAVAKRYILQGIYDHVFIASGDLVTPFTLSGFNSFQALSPVPCRPFDKDRNGINIGEAAASALVTNSNTALAEEALLVLGESSCNDANHISGPSRTGEGLYRSIASAMEQAGMSEKDIDYISAHGTATLYNDEMEAIAFNRLGLENTPVNSLKGYFGHTLGASGLLETIVGMHSLKRNTLYPSPGYKESGVTMPVWVITETTPKEMRTFLKTASGFGGCNTAVIFQKPGKSLE